MQSNIVPLLQSLVQDATSKDRWGSIEDETVQQMANANTRKNTLTAVKTFQDWQKSSAGFNDSTPLELLARPVLITRLQRFAQQVSSLPCCGIAIFVPKEGYSNCKLEI